MMKYILIVALADSCSKLHAVIACCMSALGTGKGKIAIEVYTHEACRLASCIHLSHCRQAHTANSVLTLEDDDDSN